MLFNISIKKSSTLKNFLIIKKYCIYLLFNFSTGNSQHGREDGILDEFLVGHDFGGSEGGQTVQKQCRSTFKVANSQRINAFVHFQTVSPVPVASLVNQPVVNKIMKKDSISIRI